jgi:nucleoid-associated protein YgaU
VVEDLRGEREEKLTNPNYIYIGQKLVIPEEGDRL